MSKVQQLSLHQFMAFDEKTLFEFSPGINVFIGPNSTGKTLAMKAIYALLKVCETAHRDKIVKDPTRLNVAMSDKLQGVFKPDTIGRLVRRGRGRKTGSIEVQYNDRSAQATISTLNKVLFTANPVPEPVPSIFLPAHEFLSTSEGFVFAYKNREMLFDETYYDLSLALGGLPLKGPTLEAIKTLVAPLEKELGGKITKKGERFYVRLKEGNMEATILSEGYRKITGLIYLLNNGSLTQNGILFWDEPEANLNPKLVTVVISTLQSLILSGIQVFIATHDYLVSQKLSLLAEYNLESNLKFFAFRQPKRGAGVIVESGGTLAEIQHNSILDEFAALYDQEMEFFQKTS
ncbi:MAG: AAA family ATPase [Chloroflexi bacterium]|nr:AAA family ATPase [Chloroflexota bacterium]